VLHARDDFLTHKAALFEVNAVQASKPASRIYVSSVSSTPVAGT
jgi:hypothetical protein